MLFNLGSRTIVFNLTDMTTLSSAYALLLGVLASTAAQFRLIYVWGEKIFAVKDSGHYARTWRILNRFDSSGGSAVVYFYLQYLG